MAKKPSKRQVRKAVKTVKKLPTWVVVVAIVLVIAVVGVTIYGLWSFNWDAKALLTHLGIIKESPVLPVSGELDIHFVELGNEYAGDCIYIKCGDNDILIDAGSRSSNIQNIMTYINQYVTDGVIEYCIVTHADQDHIACFGGTTQANSSLFDHYDFGTFIDFPMTNKDTQLYQRYVAKRDAEIASTNVKHYNALECYNETNGAQRIYQLSEGITLEILYNYYYENHSSDENNYSVCCVIKQGSKEFLFTGDLEKEGEEHFVEYNQLNEVEFFKSGHHGSKTSSTPTLLSVIKPKISVVTCVAGTDEYTDANENQFPTQIFCNNIAPYTTDVYVTSIVSDAEPGYSAPWGSIIISSSADGTTVTGSTGTAPTKLKDTEWFKANRTCPAAWAA